MSFEFVDCHFHFYDRNINDHPFLEKYDPKLALIWGKRYQELLPTSYMPKNYLRDMKNFHVKKLIMAELVSTDPLKEMNFAQALSEKTPLLAGAIANINLLDKNLPDLLASYAKLPVVKAVRDHLLWDPNNPEHCYARSGGILSNPAVTQSFEAIDRYQFKFEFEVYSHEIPHVQRYAKQFPNTYFALHCLGWPLNQTPEGFKKWEQDMQELSACLNVFVKITAIECIFGLNWTVEQIKPWIHTTIDIFGAKRCMFGSHLPISKLSCKVEKLFDAYQNIVEDYSDADKKQLFSETASQFYNV